MGIFRVHGPGPVGAGPAGGEPDLATALDRELALVVDRFRRLPEHKLARELAPYASRAAAGRQVAQALAEAGQGVTERGAPAAPQWRSLPELAAFAVGDQLAVTGADLLAALRDVPPAETVWTREGRRPAATVVAAALASLRWLRLS